MHNRLTRLIIIVTIMSSLFLLVYYYFYLIFPFIIATIITLYIEPMVSFLEKKLKIKRMWSTFLVLLSFLIIFMFFLFVIGKLLLSEATALVYRTTDYLHSFKQLNIMMDAFAQTISNYFMRIFPFLPSITDFSFQSYGDELIEAMITSVMAIIQTSIRSISFILYSFTQTLTIFLIIFIATSIMVYDYDRLKEGILMHIPDKLLSKLKQLYLQLKKSVFAFVKAQIIITFYTASIVWFGLFIFRIEHALLIAFFVFIIDFFPYIGVGVLFLPWIFYCFFIGNYVLTIQLAIIYMVIIILRQIMEPKIVATSIGLHPLVTVFVLFFGITTFGLLGMMLTPLLLIILSAIYHAQIIPAIYIYVKDGK